MKYSSKIWQFFFIGLLSGVIGGGAIVWFEMKDKDRSFLSQILFELNTLKLEKKIAESEQTNEKTTISKKWKSTSKQIKKTENEDVSTRDQSSDSAARVMPGNDSNEFFLSLKTSDSLLADSGLVSSENIIVRKDRLIYFTKVKLTVLDEPISGKAVKDSLLEEISGVHNEGEIKEYLVEFWESPINYKGYKMGNKKIILFGMGQEYENISLTQVENKLFLKSNDVVYQIAPTYSFESLKKVTDKSLLVKIE